MFHDDLRIFVIPTKFHHTACPPGDGEDVKAVLEVQKDTHMEEKRKEGRKLQSVAHTIPYPSHLCVIVPFDTQEDQECTLIFSFFFSLLSNTNFFVFYITGTVTSGESIKEDEKDTSISQTTTQKLDEANDSKEELKTSHNEEKEKEQEQEQGNEGKIEHKEEEEQKKEVRVEQDQNQLNKEESPKKLQKDIEVKVREIFD